MVNIQPKLAITYRVRAIAVPAVVAPSPARIVAVAIATTSTTCTVLRLALGMALRDVHLIALEAVSAGLLHTLRRNGTAVAQV